MLAATLRLWSLDVLPPGLFFDEAYNGFDARQMLLGGNWPLFFPANNGREPLFIYLQALSVAILGATPFALRLVAALVGIASIPSVYFCARTLLTPRPATAQQQRLADWLALLAAGGLAVSYWHLSLSRLGFRVNLLIPISALAIAFFWRGWTGLRLRNYAWSGFWLGLAMYTYIAARFLPLVLLAFVVMDVLLSRWRGAARDPLWEQRRPRLIGLLIVAGVAVLVATPLAWTLLANPALLSARSAQVSLWTGWQVNQPGQWFDGLLANATTALRTFYDQGDQNLRHNLPGRPANDLLLAVLFTIGWLWALVTVVSKPRSLLVLLWFVIMLAPTVLSTEAPHYLRSAGALPPLAILYALGAEAIVLLGRRIQARRVVSGPQPLYAIPLIVAMLLLVLAWSGALTARDYFQRWARLPGLGAAFDVDKQLAAEATSRSLADPASQDRLLMAAELYLQPQMGFALGPVAAAASPSILESDAAGIPLLLEDGADPRASLMLIARQDGQPVSTWLQPLRPQDLRVATPVAVQRSSVHQPGWPQITQVLLSAGTSLHARQIRYPLDVVFANGLRLVGYDVEPDVLEPGQDEARLTLFWQEDAADREGLSSQGGEWRSDFDVFANLNLAGAVATTANGQLRGQALVDRLHAGEPIVEDVRVLAVPEAASPGKAHFEVGLYRYRPSNGSDGNERIAIIDPAGQAVADQVDLGAVWIGAMPRPASALTLPPLGIQFDDRIELVGANVIEDPVDSRRFLVDLAWQGLDRSNIGYTAFVHLLDTDGQIIAQHDAPPGGPNNPTNLWAPGEMVRATFPLDLSEGQDATGVRLRIGLYEPVSGRQLPITAAGNAKADISGGSYVLIDLE